MWAWLAILLVVVSYIFTLALAVACVYFPALLLSAWPRLPTVVIFLAGIIVAVVILWSLLPRRDKFAAPGPCLDASDYPHLYAELARIADALNEPVPREVYLIPDVNAWVAERGGTMGFGSRRVMGLGLPLLRILTISQLRAVLAHEFAHYYGGDTRLWPWVHKTRAAMARTLLNLQSDSLADALSRFQRGQLLHHLAMASLILYWTFFMRITQAISRLHEYRADELASYIAGSKALVEGLSAIHGASAALPLFWRTEMVPAMDAGFRPSFTDGFAKFIAAPAIAAAVNKHLQKELKQATTDPYDTHPPLKDRIAAICDGPNGQEANSTQAIALLGSSDGVEIELLQKMAPDRNVVGLRPMSWDRIGEDAYLPVWRAIACERAELLADYTIERLPELAGKLNEIAQHLRDPKGMLLTREQRIERAAHVLRAALTVVLCDRGWQIHATPGEFYLECGQSRIAPPEVVAQIRSGTITPIGWSEQCRSLGITDVPLSPSAPSGGAPRPAQDLDPPESAGLQPPSADQPPAPRRGGAEFHRNATASENGCAEKAELT
jgi:heat shock protein HtpX